MKHKKFDCVRMKHEIQQQILREMARMKPDEFRRREIEAIADDPILGPFWRKISSSRRDPAPRRRTE